MPAVVRPTHPVLRRLLTHYVPFDGLMRYSVTIGYMYQLRCAREGRGRARSD
jgi:hypothetical protein